jgi:small subunit ribosomal protein S17
MTVKGKYGGRKVRDGTVVSDKMNKTLLVAVEEHIRHPLYKKRVRRLRRFMAHDEREEGKMGDRVRIVEAAPISRKKRWNLVEILERAELPDVAPESIDLDLLGEVKRGEAPAVEAIASPVAVAEPEPAEEAEPEGPTDESSPPEEEPVPEVVAEEAAGEEAASEESAEEVAASEEEPAPEAVAEEVAAEEAASEEPVATAIEEPSSEEQSEESTDTEPEAESADEPEAGEAKE